MEYVQLISMAAFALASSISPGPVNLVCLSSGARNATRAGLRFAAGATLGYVVLFLVIGFGLATALLNHTLLAAVLRYAGVAFLLFLSWQLASDDGHLPEADLRQPPGFWSGALMQWLNPKAWLAASAGIGAYTTAGDANEVMVFAALYLPICGASLSVWVGAGRHLRRYVTRPQIMRLLNRTLALLLALSSLALL